MMMEEIGGAPPVGPGSGTSPTQPSGTQKPASSGYSEEVMQTWNRLFGGKASDEELKQIINLVLKQAVDQVKKDQARLVEAIKKIRRDQEEG